MPAPIAVTKLSASKLGPWRPRRHGARPAVPAILDKRGATSVLLAGAATMLLGFAGLAVEAGSWYL